MTPRVIDAYRKDVRWPAGHGYGHNIGTEAHPVWTAPRPAPFTTEIVHSTNNEDPTTFEHELFFLRDSPDVSCHDLIAKNGDVYVVLPEGLEAWQAGVALPAFTNPHSFGTELHVSLGERPTAAQIESLAYRIQQRRQKYGTTKEHIDTHRAVALPRGRKRDPEGWPDDAFYRWRDGLFLPASTGLTIQSPPRISLAQFTGVLARAHSPAAPDALDLYAICLHAGIDPAVALAFFGKESTFGTQGIATRTLNWGNVRQPYRAERAIGMISGFAQYAAWTTSLEDWCDRIRGRYVQERGLTTVEQIVPVYAPAYDDNDVERYIQFVVEHVQQWQHEDVPIGRYVVAVDVALIREGPGQEFPVALGGTAKAARATELFIDEVKAGTPVQGDPVWLHLASGIGFIHRSVVRYQA